MKFSAAQFVWKNFSARRSFLITLNHMNKKFSVKFANCQFLKVAWWSTKREDMKIWLYQSKCWWRMTNVNCVIKPMQHSRVWANTKPFIMRTREFKCSICENRFLSQRNLQSHMITHTSEKPFQCDECSKTFNNHGSLLKHKESQHKETRFNCDNCNYKALQKATLILHKQSVHEGLKFQCDKCNHKVSWKVVL